ncbi:uncharacterized protein LOC132734871 [Ruditapes philippinarum]|uniref:uncharacterized protein LOC132734871 n=1 Tax=Ruditapes philippinarum TaxID=129788 RepID=UPI00295B12D1|nr:uncharacterized protein LOC132734871 [Ruditapes philippinarum]
MTSAHLFAYIFLRFVVHVAIGNSMSCFEVGPYLKEETGLGAEKFWGSKTQGVEHCMKLCVRQAQCQSINYDLTSKFCELNKTLRNGGQTKSSTNLYSGFKSWPKTFDQHCSSRPCKENEVCIPKTLLTSSADSSGCGHACILFGNSVCPMPTAGTFVGRKVGSVNVVTCPKGKTGGGQATCEADLKWSSQIPGCVDIYNHSCSDNILCSKIGAKCTTEGKCQCVHSMYNETTSQCQPVLRLDGGSEQNDTVDGFLQFYDENEWKAVCKKHWNWKATSVACRHIRSDLIYGGTFHTYWKGGTASTLKKIKFRDIDCTGNEEFLQDCKNGEEKDCDRPELALTCFKYNVSEAANKPLALFESIHALQSEPVTIDSENMTGILAVKVNGRWGIVCKKGFDGKHVACKSLNPKWKSGSDEAFDISDLQENYLLYTQNVDCKGDETHLFYCENNGWNTHEPCSNGEIIRLECEPDLRR